MANRTCSFPGCGRIIPWGKFCRGHRPIKGIAGGIYCQICGFGPRTALAKHVIAFHDGCTAYKRQFGEGSLESHALRNDHPSPFLKVSEGGRSWKRPKKQRTCDKGHRLAGHNLMIKHKGGRDHRGCRKCHMEEIRERTWRNRPTWRRRWRKCHLCGEAYLPIRKNQRFCCAEHQIEAGRAKRRKGGHRPRKCEGCGKKFTPRSGSQRFHSAACRRKKRWGQHHHTEYPKRQCSICPRFFKPKRVNHIVCSDDCRAKAARQRAAAWTAAHSSTH